MPTARAALSASVVNGILYAVGGSNNTGTLGTVEAYDPASNSWTTDASMPTARFGLSTSVVNDVIYAVGGNTNILIILGTVEAFAPAPQNQPPVANAGANQTVECAGPSGTSVTLNGSASSDPDGDTLTYKWTDATNNVLGTSATITVTAPMGTTAYTLTVTDPGGLSSSATTNVTVRDTTPPTLTLSQSSLTAVLPTASATGATVSLAGIATATDICDPSPTITNNAPAVFPIGTTQVTFTATDHSGNSTEKTLVVQVVYNFNGYFVPILNDGSSIFQSGRTVPVKFALTAADGTIVSNAVASLFVAMTSNLAIGTNDMTDATSSGGSDTGSLFRFDPTSGQYIYNLNTSGYAGGTWLIRTTLNDGTVHNALISIR